MGRLRDAGRRSSANSLSSSGTAARNSKLVVGGGGGYGDADVAKLKGAIQTLCQSTHPLGEKFFWGWVGVGSKEASIGGRNGHRSTLLARGPGSGNLQCLMQ